MLEFALLSLRRFRAVKNNARYAGVVFALKFSIF
jgi:hypothetical protein